MKIARPLIVLALTVTALLACNTSPTAPQPTSRPGQDPPPQGPPAYLTLLAGAYDLTIEAAESCPFPTQLKVRTYDVVVETSPYAYLGVRPAVPDKVVGGDIWALATGRSVLFKWNPWDLPACLEPDTPGPTGLTLCGEGDGTLGDGTISGLLYGSAYLGEGPQRPSCTKVLHRFTFRRKS